MSEVQLRLPDAVRLAEVLERAHGDHTARVVDVAGEAEDTVRLLLEDGDAPLSAVISHGLTLGQAATILVPLSECVITLASAGVVHGAIGVDAVRVDERGAPILGGFESARLTAASERDAGRVDHVGFVRLASAVIDAVEVDDGDARALVDVLIDSLDTVDRDEITAFGERLLEAARPEPLAPAAGMPEERSQAPAPRPTTLPRLARPRASSGTPPSRSVVRSGLLNRLRRLGSVRKRFWVLGGGAVAALGFGLVLLATEPSASTQVGHGDAAEEPGTASVRVNAGLPGAPAPTTGLPVTSRLADPAAALQVLRPDVTAAEVVDDYGDVVLLRADSAAGPLQLLLERTELGWRLRDSFSEEVPRDGA